MDVYRTVWDNILITGGMAVLQIGVWWMLNQFISKAIGRSTKDDYVTCIAEKIWGPAVIRVGIHVSTAFMVSSAFGRWI